MKKPPRRRKWHGTAKTAHRGLKKEPRKPDLYAQFTARYGQGGTVREHAEALAIPIRTATRWANDVQITAAERFKRQGCGAEWLVSRWLQVERSSRGHVRNRALMEIGAIQDIYPARKEPQLPVNPITVLFDTDITIHEKAIHVEADKRRTILVQSGQERPDTDK